MVHSNTNNANERRLNGEPSSWEILFTGFGFLVFLCDKMILETVTSSDTLMHMVLEATNLCNKRVLSFFGSSSNFVLVIQYLD